jgi:hypothetical protein
MPFGWGSLVASKTDELANLETSISKKRLSWHFQPCVGDYSTRDKANISGRYGGVTLFTN